MLRQTTMAFTEQDISAFRLLLSEEFELHIQPFRREVLQRFDQISGQFDGLYLRDEKREQEYLAIREQVSRIEKRIA